MIRFLCPNGHSLTAPDNLAGKPGKCPRCDTPFVVPAPSEAVAAPTGLPMAAVDGGGSTAIPSSVPPVTPALGSGLGKAAAGEIFVFLCPNGHKLNGPPSMKGKPGQCPHCGARFRIPTDEEIQEQARAAEEAASQWQPEGNPAAAGAADHGGINFNQLLGGAGDESTPDRTGPPPGPAAMGYIVGRLWEQRNDDTQLEVFLNEGEIIVPDYYSEALSTSDYGVFAVHEGDGTFTATVIPWSAVRRVGMRRIGDLPGELFQ